MSARRRATVARTPLEIMARDDPKGFLRLFLLVLDEHERRELMSPRIAQARAVEAVLERMGASDARGEEA
jgi:hypothetical protein